MPHITRDPPDTMTMRQRLLAYLAVACLLAAATVTLTTAYAARSGDVWGRLDLLVDVRHELVAGYVDEPDTQKMMESAVHGMIDSLDDPYTAYLPPDDWDRFDRLTRGEFSGIGAEIDVENRQLKIVTPLEDSPAWKAGVMAGDTVTHIDGEPTTEIFKPDDTRDKMLQAAVDHLTGEPGTKVTITVKHEAGAEGETQDLTITRGVIQIQTVRGFRRNADHHYDYMIDPASKIGYVRLSQFNEHTAEDLAKAIDELKAQGVRGLILDVRYNPGGLLQSAVEISDMFLTEGQTIVSVRGRAVPPQVYSATSDTKMPTEPIVILANEASASASEIVTGALKENDRALFVGTRTYGKGSVQAVKMLGDQATPLGALKFTQAYYYGPDDRLIHRKEDSKVWGIDPSEGDYVPMTPDQRSDMIKTRRDADVLRPGNGNTEATEVTPQWVEQTLKDPQLAAALRAVKGKLDTGDWPDVGQADTDALVHEGELANLRKNRELLVESLDKLDAKIAELTGETAEGKPSDPASGAIVPHKPADQTMNEALEDVKEQVEEMETVPAE